MTKMVATKSMTYATRRLLPDDQFDAKSPRDAKLLNAIGKARYVTDQELAKAEKREAAAQKRADAKADAAAVLALVDDVPFLRFKSLATEVLGDDTPSTKAEIIAALEKRAG